MNPKAELLDVLRVASAQLSDRRTDCVVFHSAMRTTNAFKAKNSR